MQPQGLQVHWVIPTDKARAVQAKGVSHVWGNLIGTRADEAPAQGKHLLHSLRTSGTAAESSLLLGSLATARMPLFPEESVFSLLLRSTWMFTAGFQGRGR